MDTAQLAAVAGSARVHRSFGFIDLSGFTDFVDEHGDEAALEELQHLRGAVREVAPMFGVRVEKWLGDGCMLVGVDYEPMVAAVVAIQQRHLLRGSLSLRAGIAVGDVLLLEGDDYVGQAVNLASRLCDNAKADQVLAHAADLHLPTWVVAAEQVDVPVKGFSEPVAAAVLVPEESVLDEYRQQGVLLTLVDGLTRSWRPKRD
jgi:class 3 adenylate cyclase